jgi:hypothetical protein
MIASVNSNLAELPKCVNTKFCVPMLVACQSTLVPPGSLCKTAVISAN